MFALGNGADGTLATGPQAQRQREELAAAADDDEEEEEDDDDDDDDPEARLDMEDDEAGGLEDGQGSEARRQIIARWAEICQMLLLILAVTFSLTFAPFHYIRTPSDQRCGSASLAAPSSRSAGEMASWATSRSNAGEFGCRSHRST